VVTLRMGRVAVDDAHDGRRAAGANDSTVAIRIACGDMSRVRGILRVEGESAEVLASVSGA
jgi:hypothetical protein